MCVCPGGCQTVCFWESVVRLLRTTKTSSSLRCTWTPSVSTWVRQLTDDDVTAQTPLNCCVILLTVKRSLVCSDWFKLWRVLMFWTFRWFRIRPSLTSWWCPTCTEIFSGRSVYLCSDPWRFSSSHLQWILRRTECLNVDVLFVSQWSVCRSDRRTRSHSQREHRSKRSRHIWIGSFFFYFSSQLTSSSSIRSAKDNEYASVNKLIKGLRLN